MGNNPSEEIFSTISFSSRPSTGVSSSAVLASKTSSSSPKTPLTREIVVERDSTGLDVLDDATEPSIRRSNDRSNAQVEPAGRATNCAGDHQC